MSNTTEGPGHYTFPAVRRGDTFRARDIATITLVPGAPVAVTAARLQVRAKHGGPVLLEWSTTAATITIVGTGNNVVRLAEKPPAQMQLIPAGQHDYDLEVTFASDSAKITILAGKFPVTTDITRDS